MTLSPLFLLRLAYKHNWADKYRIYIGEGWQVSWRRPCICSCNQLRLVSLRHCLNMDGSECVPLTHVAELARTSCNAFYMLHVS